MEFLYFALFFLYALVGYLFYKQRQLTHKLNEQNIAHKKSLAEAGNAIADTLKIAFDNLKRNNSKIDKAESNHTEYQSRFHRLEQNIQRVLAYITSKENPKEKISENKNERRHNKTN